LRPAAEPIDLGNEPPLLTDGASSGLVDRRRVSVQWFSGTILTGLCGAALMGGAVFIALDGEANFAALPERVGAAIHDAVVSSERVAGAVHKSDKLPPAGETSGARQTFRVSIPSRVGDREVMRSRPYVRVAANLSLSTSALSASLPKFNPTRLMMEDGRGSAAPADETPGAEPDAEVSFVTRDLASVLPRVKIAAVAPLEDVVARVRDAAEWSGNVSRPITASLGPVLPNSGPRLNYAPDGTEADPYAGFEARIVPENITMLPKSTRSDGANALNERVVTVKKNESVASILRDQGASPDDIRGLTAVLGPRGRDGGLREGQKLRILFAPDAGRLRVVRVIVAGDSIEAVVALSDVGKYVAVDVQSMGGTTEVAEADDDDENDSNAVRLYQSIYETALRNQVPRPVIDDLVRIYSYDVDFQRRAQPGDSFEVLYSGEDDAGANNANNDVLFAALTVGGETKKFYRYLSPDDGVVDYYDETGKSAKKFLVRKPVGLGIMRSGFGFRRHPILGYSKMHTGVDWAAPYGTPIFASGNGVVEKVGWEGGYGKYIRVKHSNGYETAYGHMSAFARGIEPGKKVRQGQVIGFVGSTGLSTGAHVHYEIVVNGRFVDPMRIRLPRGRVLEGPVLAQFEKERDRMDAMMQQRRGPPARMAARSETN
jgi:murein DD-endopeptidase MepM/ murein hydrolase activator NlpD